MPILPPASDDPHDGAGAAAEALAIDGRRVVALGDVAAVRSALTPDAVEVDAVERTVVSGFADAFDHQECWVI